MRHFLSGFRRRSSTRWVWFTVLPLALFTGYLLPTGCVGPTHRVAAEPDTNAVVAAPSNTGGLQSTRTYGAGDPWPERLRALGYVFILVALVYSIRRLGLSRPDNGN